MINKDFSLAHREDISKLLAELNIKDGIGAEIGVQEGNFSEIILESKQISKLYMIDCWDLVNVDDAPQNDSGHSIERLKANELLVRAKFADKNAEVIKSFSIDAAFEFKDNFFDFIYIDAAHDEVHVREDLEVWYPKVKSGGVMSGHDYLNNKPFPPTYVKFGVIEAVSKFRVTIPDHEFFITEEDYLPSWVIIKP